MERKEISQEEVLRLFGDPKEVSERIRRFTEDQVFVDEHFQELYSLYPGQYIAVGDKKVLFSAPTLNEFIEKAEVNPGGRGDLVWRHLERNPLPLILTAA